MLKSPNSIQLSTAFHAIIVTKHNTSNLFVKGYVGVLISLLQCNRLLFFVGWVERNQEIDDQFPNIPQVQQGIVYIPGRSETQLHTVIISRTYKKSVGFHSVSVRRRTYGEDPFSMTFHGFVGTRSTQPTILWTGCKSHLSALIHFLDHVKDIWCLNEINAFRTLYSRLNE